MPLTNEQLKTTRDDAYVALGLVFSELNSMDQLRRMEVVAQALYSVSFPGKPPIPWSETPMWYQVAIRNFALSNWSRLTNVNAELHWWANDTLNERLGIEPEPDTNHEDIYTENDNNGWAGDDDELPW